MWRRESWAPRAACWKCHRNTVLNRLNAFEAYTGLEVQRPYDAAAVIIALEWQGPRP
ncbi:helix-turn-helix domain-containing protein [Streptomyces sp. NPDC059649]|uniref:helix-turn-helix domain-containing protein n=1 Tax=Streptomyces sp. NPDC059649 TaxID=3346895 RepID=UPI00368BF345